MKYFEQRKFINILLLGAFIILTLNNFLAYRQIQHLLESNIWVAHTHKVIEAASDTLINLANLNYRVNQAIINKKNLPTAEMKTLFALPKNNIILLQSLTKDNVIQQNYLNQLEPLLTEKYSLFQTVITKLDRSDYADVTPLYMDQRQQQLNAEIKAILENIIQIEQSLLVTRDEQVSNAAKESKDKLFADGIFSDLLFLASFVLLNYYLIQRNRAETKNRESQERLKLLINSAHDYAIFMLDKNGLVSSWNTGAEIITGYKEEEIIGKHFSCFYPSELIEQQLPKKALQSAKEQGQYISETWHIRKDGTQFFASEEINALRNDNNELIGYSIVARDLTESRKVEKMKNEFISVVSHELRTPLTSIRGSLGIILSGTVGTYSDKTKQFLEIANKNCDRLLLLIHDILDVEKITEGKMEFELRVTSLRELVTDAIKVNKLYADNYSVSLRLVEGADFKVNVDCARLSQVLTNLISNAVKFSPRDSEVMLDVVQHENKVRVSVTDKGEGIAKEFEARIFNRFAQADSSDTRSKAGTGLGLNISKAIIEKLNGSLNFTSIPHQATTFYFDLPIVPETVMVVEKKALEPVSFQAQRALICEDDEDQASYLRELLKAAGFQVDIGLSVLQAKRFLSKNTYSVLFLDLILPDQDGISFIRELRNDPKTVDLPIIVISIVAETGRNLLNGSAFSVIDWLNKPVNYNELLNAVTRIKFLPPVNGKPVISSNKLPRRSRILHIEDQVDIQEIVATLLKNYVEIEQVGSVAEARKILLQKDFDLVLLDLLLPDGNGRELLPMISKYKLPVVVYSAHELDNEYSKYVTQALLKANTTNEQLLATITSLLKLPT